MQYAASDVTPHERYKLLTAFVLPRPIAWVTTVGPSGVVNAAPFSFFNVFAEDPPLCMVAINKRRDGRIKDRRGTLRREVVLAHDGAAKGVAELGAPALAHAASPAAPLASLAHGERIENTPQPESSPNGPHSLSLRGKTAIR